MGAIKEYLMSVTSAAIICGVITGLTKKSGSISAMLKMLAGLFMTMTVLSPVMNLPLLDFPIYLDHLSDDAQSAAIIGEEIANDEMQQIIMEHTQAYILKKAKALGADIEVVVYLQDLIPSGVRIIGQTAPYTKKQLSQYISDNLGISLEDQLWIG